MGREWINPNQPWDKYLKLLLLYNTVSDIGEENKFTEIKPKEIECDKD